MPQKKVDITPSPRVLRMLGQIDFKPWQCLAELIDNSIDSFLDQRGQGFIASNPRVTIELPSEHELQEGDGELVVRDNGAGMSLEQLRQAVRAGYSGNDPVEKMGLFGMGFNISTARLGKKTEVWTTTAESSEWIGVVIDFFQLEKAQTFQIPVLTREKTEYELEIKWHGTEVHVKKLEPDRIRSLTWGAGKAKTRNKLGKIYGRVMASLGITILYSGDNLKPWRHCTWDSKRNVETKEFGYVPAIILIDEKLTPRKYCTTCWVWLNSEEKVCPSCGLNDHLIERQRKLKGWIGVQRYFDKENYGFDLIRNGRVIEELDKSLFYFEDSQGERELEYPIDATHWGGRFVGELEIDFVRVSHQKDSFDKLDPEWKHVIELVRGNSPLRPQIAARMGFARNTSPLAKLFSGYRSGYAGLNDLVPGDTHGIGMNSGIIRDYVERFYNGEEDYQGDEKWFDLVKQAEMAKHGGTTGSTAAGGVPPIVPIPPGEQGLPVPPDTEVSPPDASTVQFDTDKNLSRIYELDIDGIPIAISVLARIEKNEAGKVPFTFQATGTKVEFDYNPQHPLFAESLELPLDCFLVDMAQHFQVLSSRAPRDWPVSTLARKLREEYFPDTLSDITRSSEMASALLKELREHIDEKLPSHAPIDSKIVDKVTYKKIQSRALKAELGNKESVVEMIKAGKFVKYVDNKFLIKIIEMWPEIVMDGEFFSTPYLTLDSNELKKEALQMLLTGIEDAWWLVEEGRYAMSKDMAWRLRYGRALASIKLVQSWRS